MKVLLVGNGAREHAVAERLAQDCNLYAVMSKKNPAIAQLSKEFWICDIENPNEVRDVIEGKDFDLGFSSPDGTLAAGITDVLAESMLVASPSKAASRIEWDKSFMRNLMEEHKIQGIPDLIVTTSPDEALKFIKEQEMVAVKPIGLTGGKGVKISGDHFDSYEEACQYAESLIKKDGMVLVEEKLVGEEFTLQAFCDGSRIVTMPPVQDHKRAFVGDKGPNTGGMGSYSTGPNLPFLENGDIETAKKIMTDVIHALKKADAPFTGILYGQFIVTAKGIRVIEFNARFGDPEAMNVLSLLEGSLSDVFLSMAEGQIQPPKFSNDSTVVKYLVPDGYPTNPKKDVPVEINDTDLENSGAKVFYASVYENQGTVYTTSSRAFGILGKAPAIEDAQRIAESACSLIKGPLWHREDIGTKELIGRKIEHMRSLRGV